MIICQIPVPSQWVIKMSVFGNGRCATLLILIFLSLVSPFARYTFVSLASFPCSLLPFARFPRFLFFYSWNFSAFSLWIKCIVSLQILWFCLVFLSNFHKKSIPSVVGGSFETGQQHRSFKCMVLLVFNFFFTVVFAVFKLVHFLYFLINRTAYKELCKRCQTMCK